MAKTQSLVSISFMRVMYANMQPENADSSVLWRVFRSTCMVRVVLLSYFHRSVRLFTLSEICVYSKSSEATKSCLGKNSLTEELCRQEMYISPHILVTIQH